MTDPIIKPSAFAFDEAKLRRALPFELQQTSLPGVFTIPAPPAGFDPRTATAAELRRAGMLWRRSAANRNRTARALWDLMTSRKFSPEDRIVPEFGPPLRRTRRPRRPPSLPDEGGINQDWAGAVVATGQWTGVIGSWTVPTISPVPHQTATAAGWWISSWVGLDGYAPNDSNDLLQIGVIQHLDDPHSPLPPICAFYEWWMQSPPQNPPTYVNTTPIMNFDVAPGDTVVAIASYISGMVGHVFLFNHRTGKNFSLALKPPHTADFNGSSAEWVVESPSGGEGSNYSLPAFTPVTFTAALACNCSDLSNPTYGDPSTATRQTIEVATPGNQSPTFLTSTTVTDSTVEVTFTGG
jgi:hypothetical protein